MQEWWHTLDIFMKSLWAISLFSSLVFTIQSIMTFIGMDSGTDFDTDISSDIAMDDAPFQLFTFRNFINFFLGFGWTAITFRSLIDNTLILLFIAFVVGALLVTAVMYIFKWMSKMTQSGNISTEDTINCKGSVYLTIPGQRQGEGKVQITVRNAIREYDAITNGDKLMNGTPIKVIEKINNYTLLVERI